MSDTPTSITLNRVPAHYPADVTPPKRRRNAELTAAQRASLNRVRKAAQELADARARQDRAFARRIEVVRAEWERELHALGFARIAREVGEDLIGEATVRGYTNDMRARDRAED